MEGQGNGSILYKFTTPDRSWWRLYTVDDEYDYQGNYEGKVLIFNGNPQLGKNDEYLESYLLENPNTKLVNELPNYPEK